MSDLLNEQTRLRPRIVLLESEPSQARRAMAALTAAGYDCHSIPSPSVSAMTDLDADVLVADLDASPGTDLLGTVQTHSPETAVIMLVSSPTAASGVAAMRRGAFDYLTKPINPDELTAVVARALEMAALRRENRILREQIDVASMAAAFVAESAASRELSVMIRRAAPANAPVLIEGESGTGKELIARMLHHWSSRADGPFIRLSFKMLSVSVGDTAVSAHSNGGSGAAAMLEEYASRARGGTLFLDEIADASAEFQAALLAMVGEGSRERARPRASKQPAFRIVGSTNRPLGREMAAARFRPDLYFALNVISIQVAPLRERVEDIIPLARHFLALSAAETGRSMTLTPEAEAALMVYSWPGNVRELANVIERAAVMSPGERIAPESLGIQRLETLKPPATEVPRAAHEVQAGEPAAVPEPPKPEPKAQAPAENPAAAPAEAAEAAREAGLPMEGSLQDFLDRAAAIRIGRAIEAAGGNRNSAAAALGIDRTTLYRLMRRLGL